MNPSFALSHAVAAAAPQGRCRGTPMFGRWLLSCLLCLVSPSLANAHSDPFVEAIAAKLKDPELYLSSTVPHERLLTGNNALVSLHPGTRATIEAMERLIDGAQHEVLLQIYEYDDADEAANRVFMALQRRVCRAVARGETLAVGFVVSRAWPSENVLQQRNIEKLIAAVRNGGRGAANITFTLSRYQGTLFSILHTKSLVTDGSTALVMTGNLLTHGGIDVDSFNMAAEVRGPVVGTLRADWAQAFGLSTQVVATGPHNDGLGHALVSGDLEYVPAQAGALHAAVLSRTSRWAPWPDPRPSLQAEGIATLLRNAERNIYIINPSIGAATVQDALVDAIISRKVTVTAVLSRYMNAVREHRLFGGDNAEQAYKLYLRLLARGGPQAASRLRILWGSVDGVHPGVHHSAGNIHAKVTAIDDGCLMIGSTNYNWLSFNTSREVTVALMGEGVTQSFYQQVWPQILGTAVLLHPLDIPRCRNPNKQDIVCLFLDSVRVAHP